MGHPTSDEDPGSHTSGGLVTYEESVVLAQRPAARARRAVDDWEREIRKGSAFEMAIQALRMALPACDLNVTFRFRRGEQVVARIELADADEVIRAVPLAISIGMPGINQHLERGVDIIRRYQDMEHADPMRIDR